MIAPVFELLKYNGSIIYCHILFTILLHVLAPGTGGKRRESEVLILDSDLEMGVGRGWRKWSKLIPEALGAGKEVGPVVTRILLSTSFGNNI